MAFFNMPRKARPSEFSLSLIIDNRDVFAAALSATA
jgi:hypothetical protein